MTPSDLVTRVTRAGAPVVALLALGGWWLAGVPAAAGCAGGGLLALANFRWLGRDVSRAAARAAEGRSRPAGLVGLGLRQAVTLVALGGLIASGWAHPLGVAAGLAAFPPVLFAVGLHASRQSG
jgi:hypothetical protein